jgi:hypothetical protein
MWKTKSVSHDLHPNHRRPQEFIVSHEPYTLHTPTYARQYQNSDQVKKLELGMGVRALPYPLLPFFTRK